MVSTLFKRLCAVTFNLIRRPLILTFSAFACTACTATGGAPSQLMAGSPVAAPMGMFEFCVRNPGDCNIGDASVAHLSAKTVRTAGDGAPSDAKAADTVVSATVVGSEHQPDASLDIARAINTFVNAAIAYRSDLEVWGVEDHWTLPLSRHGVIYGDCEDYALEKRAMLLAAGVPRRDVRMALVWSQRTGHHAVLVLSVEGADYVLDNADTEIRPVMETPYQWLAIQSGDSLLSWASIGASGGSSPDDTGGAVAGEGPGQSLERTGAVS